MTSLSPIFDTSGKTPRQLGQALLTAAGGVPPDLDHIRTLIRAGATLEETDTAQRTPLMVAAATNQALEAAKILLAAGANPNAVCSNKNSPLIMAVLMQNTELVDALLQNPVHKVDINYAGFKGGKTALMWAAHMGVMGAVKSLTAAGADIEMRMPSGMSAIDMADDNNKITAKRFLEQYLAARKGAQAQLDHDLRLGMPLDHALRPMKRLKLKSAVPQPRKP